MVTEIENWKDAAGHSDYLEVSTFGNIRTKRRTVLKSNGVEHTLGAKPCKIRYNRYGTAIVVVMLNGKQTTITVKNLVWNTFKERGLGKKYKLEHIDGNSENCCLYNLKRTKIKQS